MSKTTSENVKTLGLFDFERIDGLHSQLLWMGEFESCADPRGYISLSNHLCDACIQAGMAHDEPDHEAWAVDQITRTLVSA